ncbi:MAG TPA: Mov34/MPN/PAD-1 family protein [Blastocatellia bacterium]|nr:Mov34/MPN/PAD-1 family protein [Blastocatellia bacterium]
MKILIAQEILVAVNNHVSQSVKTEMGGFLLGNRYWDPSTKGEFIIIDQYVEAEPTQATAVSFNFTDAAWMQVSEDLSGKFNGKALVGWYHSHPRLGVFLSESDLQVHKERFKEPWMVALVIDPVNQRGGFFGWREDTIDSRHPVEFYEYLSGKMVETKQSGLPWVNYICYDEATKQTYKPLRLPLALPPAGAPPPHNTISSWFKMPLSWLKMPPSWFKMSPFKNPQYLALLAILVVVILISAALTRRPVEDAERKGDGSELNYKPPQPQPPPIDTIPIRMSDEAAYLDNMGQVGIKRVNMHQPNKRRRQILCDLQITFSPRVAPENCQVIVEWLKKNVPTGEMKDQPAKATYSCSPGGMNVTVTAHWPNLPQSQTIPVKFTVGNQTFHSNAGYGAVFLKSPPRDPGPSSTATTSGVASSASTTTKTSTSSQTTTDSGAPGQGNGAPPKSGTELDGDGKPKKPPTEMERKNEGEFGRNGYGTAISLADRSAANYEPKKKESFLQKLGKGLRALNPFRYL